MSKHVLDDCHLNSQSDNPTTSIRITGQWPEPSPVARYQMPRINFEIGIMCDCTKNRITSVILVNAPVFFFALHYVRGVVTTL